MPGILIENVTVVTLDPRKPHLNGHQILIEDGAIAAVAKRVRADGVVRRIDGSGMIAIPGLVNAHAHLTEILQRSFRDNLPMELWRGERARTEERARLGAEEIAAAAELACAEMLKSGVTAVVDHFSTRPGLSVSKMQAILSAFERTGIRGMLVPSLRDRDFVRLAASGVRHRRRMGEPGRPEPWQDEVREVIAHLHARSLSGVMLGPSSPLNCSDRLLREVIAVAERLDLGIHTHLLETRLQAWAAARLYPRTLCAHLAKLGFLSARLSAAHGVWLTDREIDLLAASGTSVVHNPASNLKLGSGIAPVARLKSRGVNVALGTDGGDTSDTYSIFEQVKLCAYVSRVASTDPDHWITADDALRMATVNGADAVPAWRGRIGRIKPGYRADVVLLKPGLRLRPLTDPVRQLVFSAGGDAVHTVLVDGNIVVEAGRLTGVDEHALARRVEPIGARMYRLYRRGRRQADPSEQTAALLYRRLNRNDALRR
ncbi:MAG TPA: amidohydrolase [Candidatus Eisenbacteria bacterium]|nr:amidohydrolase [Candidatus Eisenbacteria bacterium]